MSAPVRILFVEDSAHDVTLEERHLEKGGLEFVSNQVQTGEELEKALREFSPDIVLSDYTLPRMNGLEALKIVKKVNADIPVIFVSGTIGEERAIESLKQGATDYVVKDKLEGLYLKVRRALTESEEKKKRIDLEMRLIQAQKMEAIGRLAGGVAHDFNNLLTAITGYSQILLEQLSETEPMRNEVGEILKAGERAAALTRQLLAFSRKQLLEPKTFDPNELISNLEKMLRRLVSEDIELEIVTGSNLGPIKADPGQIEQVIMNLVVNSRDAMPKGGRIQISTLLQPTINPLSTETELSGGPWIEIAVADNGSGIDPVILPHVFEPFYTTKGKDRGTGLGLSTVYGIVKQSGGTIRIETELGKGTTIRVYLPRSKSKTETVVKPPVKSGDLKGSEVILLVEDDEGVRTLLGEILKRGGYTVLVARTGQEAIRLTGPDARDVDLVLTDVVMPEMSGPELARELRKGQPETRVLFMTGYTDSGVIRHGAGRAGKNILQKPFSPETLLRKVREMLDS